MSQCSPEVFWPPAAGSRSRAQGASSADLLVEQDVAREPVDLVVQAERDLAEDARPGVHLEQRLQVVVPARLSLDDAARLEAEADVLDLAPVVDGRERVADLALGLGLERAREDLAVRHVVAPVGREPGPPSTPTR